jgi:hypothetical protein
MVGHRPFTELYSSMAAQTAPSSDMLAARRLVSKFILNYELVDSCRDTGINTGFFVEGGNSRVWRCTQTRGIWGHAPPENFFNLRPLRLFLVASETTYTKCLAYLHPINTQGILA